MRFVVTLSLLLCFGTSVIAQTREPLQVTSFVYSFVLNDGTGENGVISFAGRDFGGSTVAGTIDFSTSNYLPGDTVQGSLGWLAGECCGYFTLRGTTYLWGGDNCSKGCVNTNMNGLVGDSFTFPTIPPSNNSWTVQVPAKVNGPAGYPITISYWAEGLPEWRTSRLQIPPGTLTLNFDYQPPDPNNPEGFYTFVNGTFVAMAKRESRK